MSQGIPAPAREAASVPRAGHTRVSAQALTGTARAVAAHVLGVDPGLVRAFLRDDAGYLALTVHLPLPLAGPAGSTILGSVRERRGEIGARFSELTGSLVSRVDVRVTGIVDSVAERRR